MGKKIPVVLSKDEIHRLFNEAPTQYRLHLKLMYGCGLRITELLELRIKDIDFDNRQIAIIQSKGSKSRTVPLPLILKDALKYQVLAARNGHYANSEKENYGGVFLPRSINNGEAKKDLLIFAGDTFIDLRNWFQLDFASLK